jgi:hypothetical protein
VGNFKKIWEGDALAELHQIGTARNQMKSPEWSRRASDVFTDAQVDILGLYGEATAAHFLGTDFDREATVGGDGGIDLVLRHKHNGVPFAVSVKYNHRQGGYLIVEGRQGDIPRQQLSDLSTSVIMLVEGECSPPRFCVCLRDKIVTRAVGWLFRFEFLQRYRNEDWGLGPRYVVEQKDLRPMHALVARSESE